MTYRNSNSSTSTHITTSSDSSVATDSVRGSTRLQQQRERVLTNDDVMAELRREGEMNRLAERERRLREVQKRLGSKHLSSDYSSEANSSDFESESETDFFDETSDEDEFPETAHTSHSADMMMMRGRRQHSDFLKEMSPTQRKLVRTGGGVCGAVMAFVVLSAFCSSCCGGGVPDLKVDALTNKSYDPKNLEDANNPLSDNYVGQRNDNLFSMKWLNCCACQQNQALGCCDAPEYAADHPLNKKQERDPVTGQLLSDVEEKKEGSKNCFLKYCCESRRTLAVFFNALFCKYTCTDSESEGSIVTERNNKTKQNQLTTEQSTRSLRKTLLTGDAKCRLIVASTYAVSALTGWIWCCTKWGFCCGKCGGEAEISASERAEMRRRREQEVRRGREHRDRVTTPEEEDISPRSFLPSLPTGGLFGTSPPNSNNAHEIDDAPRPEPRMREQREVDVRRGHRGAGDGMTRDNVASIWKALKENHFEKVWHLGTGFFAWYGPGPFWWKMSAGLAGVMRYYVVDVNGKLHTDLVKDAVTFIGGKLQGGDGWHLSQWYGEWKVLVYRKHKITLQPKYTELGAGMFGM